jgi:ankyrin repeat protein
MAASEHIAKLIEAARYGSDGGVRFFIKRGASVDGADESGWTALHWAAAKPSLECVDALLLGGASVSAINVSGDTALHVAASRGHVEIQRLLIKAGADIKLRNNEGKTPIELAKSFAG